MYLVLWTLLLWKAGVNWKKYFHSRLQLLTNGFFGQELSEIRSDSINVWIFLRHKYLITAKAISIHCSKKNRRLIVYSSTDPRLTDYFLDVHLRAVLDFPLWHGPCLLVLCFPTVTFLCKKLHSMFFFGTDYHFFKI